MREYFINQYVLVRCRDAGVHVGKAESIEGREIVLSKSRRIWRWKGAYTLSDLALGAPLDPEFTLVGPQVTLLLSEMCEVIPLTEKAKEGIYALPEWSKA